MSSGTFEVQILGCGAALPAYNRNPSAHVVRIHEQSYLVDCGEGTQFQFNKYKVKRSKIQHIFITHLHGDHVFGLPGLITSYNLINRQDELHVYGPSGIEKMIRQFLSYAAGEPRFRLEFHEINNLDGDWFFEDSHVRVRSLPLKHKITCCGYLFEEKISKRKLDVAALQKLAIPIKMWNLIESGHDIKLEDGRIFKNDELSISPYRNRRYAYCSDTVYNEQLIPYLTNIDLLYHETTYLDELREKALENGHSTAKQAAQIAAKAGVKCLLTGHYSSRYDSLDKIIEECQSVFPNTILGEEGKVVQISPEFNGLE